MVGCNFFGYPRPDHVDTVAVVGNRRHGVLYLGAALSWRASHSCVIAVGNSKSVTDFRYEIFPGCAGTIPVACASGWLAGNTKVFRHNLVVGIALVAIVFSLALVA